MELIDIWALDRVHIKLNLLFLDELNNKLFLKFKTKKEAYNQIFKNNEVPLSTFKNILKKSNMRKFFVPLENYIKISEILNIPKNLLQSNIISYKTAGGTNYVEKPILPIKITPVFHMLFAHHIGDGTVINCGNGRLPYFGYRQFNEFYRVQYIRKIENVFGKIKFVENYFENSTRPYCPPVLSSLFFKYYDLKIDNFLSEKARIPQIIFNKGKESLLAVLIAFIIDEGHIDSAEIVINLKNLALIQDLKKICDILNYKSKVTQSKSEILEGFARIHILRKGMKKVYSDYVNLNKKYPVIDLGIKGEKIKNSFKIYDREIYKSKGNKEIIFKILRNEQLSVNQLADRLNMTRQGIRFHIHNLIKENKIKIIDNTSLNWVYGA